jgi:hypothetical protein
MQKKSEGKGKWAKEKKEQQTVDQDKKTSRNVKTERDCKENKGR